MYCVVCGKEIPEGKMYCTECEIKKQGETMLPPPTVDINSTNPRNSVNVMYLILSVLVVIALAVIPLLISQNKEIKNIKSQFEEMQAERKTLMVLLDDSLTGDELSDSVQISNALENGGLIRISMDEMNENLHNKIGEYGAYDVSGSYYVFGALINYISSEGWKLEQAPSSGLSNYFYFSK